MGVFFRPTPDRVAQVHESLLTLLNTPPPADDATKNQVLAPHLKRFQQPWKALEPRFPVFIGAAVLLLILLGVTVGVAMAADAQAAGMAQSQLKTLSSALITGLTSLVGAIVGMITGEAVSKKE